MNETPTEKIAAIDWKKAGERLLNAVLGAVAAVLLSWLAPFTRPPAPELVPAQQAKVEAGQKAADAIIDVFGTLDPLE
jgi:hypothetical protein